MSGSRPFATKSVNSQDLPCVRKRERACACLHRPRGSWIFPSVPANGCAAPRKVGSSRHLCRHPRSVSPPPPPGSLPPRRAAGLFFQCPAPPSVPAQSVSLFLGGMGKLCLPMCGRDGPGHGQADLPMPPRRYAWICNALASSSLPIFINHTANRPSSLKIEPAVDLLGPHERHHAAPLR